VGDADECARRSTSSVTDDISQVTTYCFEGAGRALRVIDANGHTADRTHDSNSNVTQSASSSLSSPTLSAKDTISVAVVVNAGRIL
jgi:hypothetical protein